LKKLSFGELNPLKNDDIKIMKSKIFIFEAHSNIGGRIKRESILFVGSWK